MASIGDVHLLRLAHAQRMAVTVQVLGTRAYAFRFWLGMGLLRMIARLLGMRLFITVHPGERIK